MSEPTAGRRPDSSSAARARTTSRTSTSPCPPNALVIVTGVSGSGKSSLAFDTIYAEGQRRYVESLSAYARQFLERMEKPDVDAHRRHLARPSRSARRTASATRDRRSARPPRSTTTCGCSSRASAGRSAGVRPGGRAREPRGRRPPAGRAAGRHPADRRLRDAGRGRRRGRRRPTARTRPTRRRTCATTTATAGRGADGGAGSRRGERQPASRHATRSSATLDALRRKGFGRLLVDGRAAVSFDDVEVGAAEGPVGPAGRRRSAARRSRDVLTRLTDSIETAYGEGRRRRVRARAAGGRRGRRRRAAAAAPRLLRALRVPGVRHRLRGPAAAAVLVQQPVRRLPDVPRLRQRHRARHRPRRARPDASRSRTTPSSRGASRTTGRTSPS